MKLKNLVIPAIICSSFVFGNFATTSAQAFSYDLQATHEIQELGSIKIIAAESLKPDLKPKKDDKKFHDPRLNERDKKILDNRDDKNHKDYKPDKNDKNDKDSKDNKIKKDDKRDGQKNPPPPPPRPNKK